MIEQTPTSLLTKNSPAALLRQGLEDSSTAFVDGMRGILFALVGLVLVGLIALLDYQTGTELSFSIFYLIPVVIGAWWGGFSHGILLALAGSIAWHLIDAWEKPVLTPTVDLWNGIVRFGTLVLTSSLVARLHRSVLREYALARTDPLTGAANGRVFYESIASEAERARRTGKPLTLAYLDLDHFKQLNDACGHEVGDEALLLCTSLLRAVVRPADLVARLGGDEFALWLDGSDELTAAERAESLRVNAPPEFAQLAPEGPKLSMSIGIACRRVGEGESVDSLMRRADLAMYEVKRAGRGHWRVSHEASTP